MSFEHPLMSLALVLAVGIAGGELLARLRLPRVTGWIAAGILLHSLDLPGLSVEKLSRFSPFTDFVLGYIAFTVGSALRLVNLRNAGTRLSLLVVTEALITPGIVMVSLHYLGGVSFGTSLILSSIAIAAAPGTTVVVVRESRARGVFVKTLVAAVALIDMVAVGTFAFAISFFHHRGEHDAWADSLGAVVLEFGTAFAIGAGCAMAALLARRTFVGPAFLGPLIVAVILASWGFGQVLDVSSILACTFAGIFLANVRHSTARAAEAYLRPLAGVLFAGFYTLAGMRLDFGLVVPMAGLVTLYFVARLVGKSASAFTAMSLARMPKSVRRYLGIALLPHGGVAVGLILLVGQDPALSSMADTVVAVGLATLAINQLLGPSATRFALTRAGEAGTDRPRLLDFLDEQRIVIGIKGNTKEDVIRSLADRLYATSKVSIEKEEFIQGVLDREHEESTCLGEGLMIPHATLPEGAAVTGVLGISSDGLDLEAPDGRKVHAVVLLATPYEERHHHLEILAAFASAIAGDANLREQLYQARTAAHAYAILHAEEAADFNYFLDEEMERGPL